MSDSKIRGYNISEEVYTTLRVLDRALRRLEEINSDLCLFQSETGIPVRSHVFEGIGSLREAESCFLAAQRSMEVAGHLRVIDEIASQDAEFEEARARTHERHGEALRKLAKAHYCEGPCSFGGEGCMEKQDGI